MKPARSRSLMKYAKKGVAAFCLGLFLLVEAMAAVPALHVFFHHDAGDPGHECAVTLFTHGQAHHSVTTLVVVRAAPLVWRQSPMPACVFISADVRFLPCRGPPSLLEFV